MFKNIYFNLMLILVFSISGCELDFDVDIRIRTEFSEEIKTKDFNLAQLGAMHSRVFRQDNESPCDYINRSLQEKQYGSTDIVDLPDGERIFLRTMGIDFDKDIVQYHVLIARFKDVFNEYENIEEKIYLSENEVSGNNVRVVEGIQN